MSRGIFVAGTASSSELNDCFDPPRVRVYANAAITLTSGLDTALTWTDVRWDTHSMWSGSDPTKLIVPSGDDGYFRLKGNVRFATNATGTRRLGIYVNGTDRIAHIIEPAVSGFPTIMQINDEWPLAAGDYVQLFAFQDSGGNLDVESASSYSPEFLASWYAVS